MIEGVSMKNKLNMNVKKSVAIICILTSGIIFALLIIFSLPTSRALYTTEHIERTTVSMNMFDQVLNKHVNIESIEFSERGTTANIMQNYQMERAYIVYLYPDFNIELFDQHMNNMIVLIDQTMNEIEALIHSSLGEKTEDLMGSTFREQVSIEDFVYYESLNIEHKMITRVYEETVAFFNHNREYLSGFDYIGFTNVSDVILSLVRDVNNVFEWGNIFTGYTVSTTELRENTFSMVYNEVYRQLSDIEDDPYKRKEMISEIFMEAIFDWRREFLPEYIEFFIQKKYLLLRKYQQVGAVYSLEWNYVGHRQLFGDDEDIRLINVGDLLYQIRNDNWMLRHSLSYYINYSNILNHDETDFLSTTEIMRLIDELLFDLIAINNEQFTEYSFPMFCAREFFGE